MLPCTGGSQNNLSFIVFECNPCTYENSNMLFVLVYFNYYVLNYNLVVLFSEL